AAWTYRQAKLKSVKDEKKDDKPAPKEGAGKAALDPMIPPQGETARERWHIRKVRGRRATGEVRTRSGWESRCTAGSRCAPAASSCGSAARATTRAATSASAATTRCSRWPTAW